MFTDQDEEIMRRFYTDTINSAVFNTPLNYLHKYPQIQDYAIIAHSETQVLRLLYLIVSKDLDRVAKMGELLSQQGVDERIGVVIATAAANKYADIRRQLLRKQICRGGACLLDHNWRIVNILSTNWTAGANRLLLGVTLVLVGHSQQRINIELDVHETERLLNRLKEIKRSLKA